MFDFYNHFGLLRGLRAGGARLCLKMLTLSDHFLEQLALTNICSRLRHQLDQVAHAELLQQAPLVLDLKVLSHIVVEML